MTIGWHACLAFHPREATAIAASSLPHAHRHPAHSVWYRFDFSLASGRVIGLLQNPTGFKFAPDGDRIWALDQHEVTRVVLAMTWPEGGGTNYCWGNQEGAELHGVQTIECLDVAQRYVVAGTRSGHLLHFTLADARFVPVWKDLGSPVLSVALAADESWLAAGLADGRIELFSLPDLESIATLRAHAHTVQSLAFRKSDGLLASGSEDRTVKLWRREGRELRPVFHLRHPTPVRTVSFSHNGQHLAILGKDDRGIRVWRLAELDAAFRDLGIAP
jgi:WD40 repeat protein